MAGYEQREISVFEVTVPWILGMCIDCTVSISDKDFEAMQGGIKDFLLNVHRRSYDLPDLPSDFIALTAFKDKDEIFGPPSPLREVKMDQSGHVDALCQWVDRLKNDGKATALHDAIVIASDEVQEIDSRLANDYLKIIVAITDGEDNDSRTPLSQLQYFRTTDLHLAVIAAGNTASPELRALDKFATSTHAIDRFDELFYAITITVEEIIEKTVRIDW